MNRDKRTRMYLTAASMGFIATILMVVSQIFDWPDFVAGLSVGVLLVSLVMLLLRRFRDEYIEQLWNSGTGLAFVAVVATFAFSPFLEGFVEGVTRSARDQMISPAFVGPVALLAFFVGFHLKWLRSRL